MSGRGTPLHGGQILRPCRKASRHFGHVMWDYYEMSAYRMDHGLKRRSYSSEAYKTATTKAWADDAPSERWT
ncbi:UNVERIFIED_CONTAM: hypothetical protein Sradi_0661100 [Sesamum radiatum]|uniref:Uncharacterized protein n=1 Tax=Sesamum radiatum TaxID=300843 RepID=A0AAW2VPG3_SESRA